MAQLYGAKGSFVLLRPKNKVKLLTQSAKKDLYGEMGIQNLGRIVFQKREGPRRSDFFTPVGTLPQSWNKKVTPRKLFEGKRNNSCTVRKNFNFREDDYKLAENTEFLARSSFSRSANFGPLMTNDDTLES